MQRLGARSFQTIIVSKAVFQKFKGAGRHLQARKLECLFIDAQAKIIVWMKKQLLIILGVLG